MKIRFSLFLLSSFIFIFWNPVLAVIQMIPPITEVKIQRGNAGGFELILSNIGDDDIPCKIEVFNMDVDPEGRPFIADSNYTRGCSEWIDLESEDFVLKAHESKKLSNKIKVPKEANGGYYAAIRGSFTESTIPLDSGNKKVEKGSGIQLQSQAMVVLMLTVPSSLSKSVLVPDTMFVYPQGDDSSFGSKGFELGVGKGWKVNLLVRNDGNTHTRASGYLSIWSEAGQKIGSSPLQAGKGYILPDRTRIMKAEGSSPLSDGYYMMRIALQTSERTSMSKSFSFAIYDGKVYPGAVSNEIAKLIRASTPGFILREPLLRRTVSSNSSTYLTINLQNTVQDTLKLIAKKREWILDEFGQPVLSEKNIQERSCSGWIELMDDKLIIPPGRSDNLRMKVNIPAEIAGEYYSCIVFEPQDATSALPVEFLAGRTQLLSLKSNSDIKYDLKIDSITVKKEKAPELTLFRFKFKVRNEGNVHCFVSGKYAFEKEVAPEIYKDYEKKGDFGGEDFQLLPGGWRDFEIDIPNMEKGKYRINLSVNYEREAQPVVKFQTIKI